MRSGATLGLALLLLIAAGLSYTCGSAFEKQASTEADSTLCLMLATVLLIASGKAAWVAAEMQGKLR